MITVDDDVLVLDEIRSGSTDFSRPLTGALLRPEAPALAFLVGLGVLFSFTAPGFFTGSNFQAILEEASIFGIVALGVNQVIRAGEIDVSVGSGVALCGWAAGDVGIHDGGFLLPLLVALGVGLAIGIINGLLVVGARIPSIIVTLGMLYGIRGLEEVLNQVGIQGIPTGTLILGNGSVLGINAAIVALIGAFIAVSVLVRNSPWFREVPAIGGNRLAARRLARNVQ